MATVSDMGDLIAMFSEAITIERRGDGYYDHGRYIKNTAVNYIKATAAVTPTGQKDIQMLPELARASGSVKIFTKCVLRLHDSESGVEPDIVCATSGKYEPIGISNWEHHGDYTVYICVRVGQ